MSALLDLQDSLLASHRAPTGVLLSRLVGRRRMWRIGRWIYMMARGDSANDMRVNGEAELQRAVLADPAHRGCLVVFDVGANVGDWTLSLLRQRDVANITRLQIHAFEPVPMTREVLTRRLAESGLSSDVSVVPLALSDSEGSIELYATGTAGVNSLHKDPGHSQSSVMQVRRQTVDAYCKGAGITQIDLLKCDTEGHDMSVLYGARQLLAKGRIGIVQFEYNHRWIFARHFLKDAFDLVENMPYHVGKLTALGVELHERWHPELDCFFESNYVLVHEDRVRTLRCRRGSFDRYNTYA